MFRRAIISIYSFDLKILIHWVGAIKLIDAGLPHLLARKRPILCEQSWNIILILFPSIGRAMLIYARGAAPRNGLPRMLKPLICL